MQSCKHLCDAPEAVQLLDNPPREVPATIKLCGWTDAHPEALVNAPPWVQRNTLSGHLLRYPDDCENCPAKELP